MECNRLPRERERTIFELAYIEQLSNAVDLMLVAQAQCPIGGVLYHFVQFGHPLSPAEVVWTKLVPCPLSPAHVADIKMWLEKRVKKWEFSKILTLKDHSRLNRRCTLIAIYY